MDDTQHPAPGSGEAASREAPRSRTGAPTDEIESALAALSAADAAEAPELAERLAADLSDEFEARQSPPPGHDAEAPS